MAKKASKSQQATPVATDSGVEPVPTNPAVANSVVEVEYQFVAADDSVQLLMQVNAMASVGWRVVAIVDRPGVCRAWMRRER